MTIQVIKKKNPLNIYRENEYLKVRYSPLYSDELLIITLKNAAHVTRQNDCTIVILGKRLFRTGLLLLTVLVVDDPKCI